MWTQRIQFRLTFAWYFDLSNAIHRSYCADKHKVGNRFLECRSRERVPFDCYKNSSKLQQSNRLLLQAVAVKFHLNYLVPFQSPLLQCFTTMLRKIVEVDFFKKQSISCNLIRKNWKTYSFLENIFHSYFNKFKYLKINRALRGEITFVFLPQLSKSSYLRPSYYLSTEQFPV